MSITIIIGIFTHPILEVNIFEYENEYIYIYNSSPDTYQMCKSVASFTLQDEYSTINLDTTMRSKSG